MIKLNLKIKINENKSFPTFNAAAKGGLWRRRKHQMKKE